MQVYSHICEKNAKSFSMIHQACTDVNFRRQLDPVLFVGSVGEVMEQVYLLWHE